MQLSRLWCRGFRVGSAGAEITSGPDRTRWSNRLRGTRPHRAASSSIARGWPPTAVQISWISGSRPAASNPARVAFSVKSATASGSVSSCTGITRPCNPGGCSRVVTRTRAGGRNSASQHSISGVVRDRLEVIEHDQGIG